MGADNVALFERCKDEYGNLGFISRGFGSEHQHLSMVIDKDFEKLKSHIKELSAKGMTQNEIGNLLGFSQSKVSRLLKDS